MKKEAIIKYLPETIVILCCVLICGCSKNSTTAPGAVSVPNPVSGAAIRVKFFDTTGASPVLKTVSVHHYDENGRIIRGDHYDGGGVLNWYDIYNFNASNEIYSRYNSAGVLTSRRVWEFATDGGQTTKATIYDSSGNVMSYTVYEHGKLINADFTYNSLNAYVSYDLTDPSGNGISWTNGNEIITDGSSSYTYGPTGTLQNYEVFVSSANGRMQFIDYNGAGTPTGSVIYEYDSQGHTTRTTSYDNTGAVSDITIYDYDNSGWLLKYSFYDKNGKMTGYFQNYY